MTTFRGRASFGVVLALLLDVDSRELPGEQGHACDIYTEGLLQRPAPRPVRAAGSAGCERPSSISCA